MAAPAAPKGGAIKRQQKESAPYSDSSDEELVPPVPIPRKGTDMVEDAPAGEKLGPMEPTDPEEGTVLPPLPKRQAAKKPRKNEPEGEEPAARAAPGRPAEGEQGDEEPAPRMREAAPVQKKQVPSVQIPGRAQAKESDRVPSGIPGLDELLGGGFEKTSTVIVTGDPGCGKTTFLAQFLYNGAAQYGDAGVMLTFEEQKDSIERHMKGYGFDFAALERQGLFATISYRPHEVKKLIDEGGGLILDTISSIGAKRLAIDSLTSYAVLFESTYQMREAELLLFEFLSKWKCTTLVSAEGVKALRRKTSVGTASLADGVIMLHHPRHKALRYRALEVLKMRGTRQSEKLCPFEFIEGVGIKVYPNEEIFYQIKEKEA